MQVWIELWLASSVPVGFYLAALYAAFRVGHIRQSFPLWRWSWILLKIAIAGGLFVRLDALLILWRAGMDGSHDLVNVEAVLGAWAISFGIWLHAWLLWRWAHQHLE